jgi:hypothetical protein
MISHIKNKSINVVKIFVILFVVIFATHSLQAGWVQPTTGNTTGSDVHVPVNTTTANQTKGGKVGIFGNPAVTPYSFLVSTLPAFFKGGIRAGSGFFQGDVIVGNANPSNVNVFGDIRILGANGILKNAQLAHSLPTTQAVCSDSNGVLKLCNGGGIGSGQGSPGDLGVLLPPNNTPMTFAVTEPDAGQTFYTNPSWMFCPHRVKALRFSGDNQNSTRSVSISWTSQNNSIYGGAHSWMGTQTNASGSAGLGSVHTTAVQPFGLTLPVGANTVYVYFHRDPTQTITYAVTATSTFNGQTQADTEYIGVTPRSNSILNAINPGECWNL